MKNNNNILFKDLSYKIIGIAFKIHRLIGPGLPEHCYYHAFVHELSIYSDIPFLSQKMHKVFYDETQVGHFFTDLIIDDKIIIELKSDEKITSNHFAQLLTYLRVAKLKIGYIINFGSHSVQFKRLIL